MSSWPGAHWLANVAWAHPWAALLWPLALLWVALPPHREQHTALRVPFFALAVAGSGERPRAGAIVRAHGVRGWFTLGLAWSAGVLAVMQPHWLEPPIPRVQSARDWLLAIDLSPSMQTTDFRDADGRPVDRLSVVGDVLNEFLARRADDRIGLLIFAEQAHVQAPFTRDHGAVSALLAEAQIGMAGSRTMIGDAIGMAIKVFDQSAAPQRTLVLLTDGVDTGSRIPPAKAAEIAARRGVRIHTVAIGTASAAAGEQPDLEALRSWAAIAGGRAFSADDRDSLAEIYRELDAIEGRDEALLAERPRRPLFHWFVATALALIIAHQAAAALRGWRASRVVDRPGLNRND